MNPTILTLRLSRRAIAAAVVSEEVLSFIDAHYLSSRRVAAVGGTRRYVVRLLEMVQPQYVAVEAANHGGEQTVTVLNVVKEIVTERKIPIFMLSLGDVLCAFGVPALRSRKELHALVLALVPDIPTTGPIRLFAMDAAAAALVMECNVGLGLVST